MASMDRDWDIFCRVVDNFGDIGVCWRLARQLAGEHGLPVRLWVDELAALQPLCPEIDIAQTVQSCHGVDIRRWPDVFPSIEPAAVVIEAFACELPAAYVGAMAARPTPPCWINLEYLTAEDWAVAWHGMASPHPTLPLRKFFFFPGFSPASGGLLRERSLFQRQAGDRVAHTKPPGLDISLFCYDNAPVAPLLDALATGPQPVRCHVPPGKPLAAVAAHLGSSAAQRIGNLQIVPIPFLAQPAYDALLWQCDINFVRGEDSFVRAQWAGKPFVWQIYPQEADAHWPKLEAFLASYTADMAPDAQAVTSAMFRAWNSGDGVSEAWQDFLARREPLTNEAQRWAKNLERQTDLASRLVKFSAGTV